MCGRSLRSLSLSSMATSKAATVPGGGSMGWGARRTCPSLLLPPGAPLTASNSSMRSTWCRAQTTGKGCLWVPPATTSLLCSLVRGSVTPTEKTLGASSGGFICVPWLVRTGSPPTVWPFCPAPHGLCSLSPALWPCGASPRNGRLPCSVRPMGCGGSRAWSSPSGCRLWRPCSTQTW